MSQEEELKTKRLKIYLAPLMPINPPLIANLDKSLIDINKSQVFIYSEDIYRELFSYILLEKGKQVGRKPTYKILTLDDLVTDHFNNESLTAASYPDILFILHTSGYAGNPIYGPVCNKIIEERSMLRKTTYVFFKGSLAKARVLGIIEGRNVVDYGSALTRRTMQTSRIQDTAGLVKYDMEPVEEEEEKPVKKAKAPKYNKKAPKKEANPNEDVGPITATDSKNGLIL